MNGATHDGLFREAVRLCGCAPRLPERPRYLAVFMQCAVDQIGRRLYDDALIILGEILADTPRELDLEWHTAVEELACAIDERAFVGEVV